MFAITTLFVRPSGEIAKEEGTLFSLPPELRTARRLEAYSKVSPGWSKDDLGYWSYACRSWDGDKVVVPGLIINGEKVRKKIYGYTVSFDRKNIENFAHGIIESLDFAYQKASENINLLIHDLRRLSGGMYNAAKEAEYLVDRNADYGDIKSRILNVINFQSMIKIRTDVLDFAGNHASVVNEDEINFFRKIDKVCRCFKSMAARKSIDIDLTGSSFSAVLGPDIL